MTRFFEFVVDEKIIKAEYNPMKGVIVGASRDEELDDDKKITAKALRPEIRSKIFALVMSHPVLKPILITLAFTGLRPQEVIALNKDKDINLSQKTIAVNNAIKKTYKFDEEGNVIERDVILGKTKTATSVRSFIMPDIVVETLTEWLAYCEKNGIKSEWLFPNTRDGVAGERRTYASSRSLLKRFLIKHGLDNEGISLKTFRHTFATMLLEKREHPRIVADLMGHAKASTTMNIYSHIVSKTVYQETANTLDATYSEFKVDEMCEKLA